MVSATASAAASAVESRSVTPSTSIPSSAIITVAPANSTARPAVFIASTTASSLSRPPARLSRKRVTMNSA